MFMLRARRRDRSTHQDSSFERRTCGSHCPWMDRRDFEQQQFPLVMDAGAQAASGLRPPSKSWCKGRHAGTQPLNFTV